MRATVVALVVMALAGLAHVLGGGELPPGVVLVALTALVLACTAVLAGRRIGPDVAFVALGAGQLVLHRAFEAFTTATCSGATTTPGGHAHHADHAASLAQAAAACTTTAVHGSTAVGGAVLGGSAMLVTHVVATVAAALVIGGADRALAWLVVWLRPLAPAPAAPVVPALGTLPVPAVAVSLTPQTWRGAVPRRGPPTWHTPAAP